MEKEAKVRRVITAYSLHPAYSFYDYRGMVVQDRLPAPQVHCFCFLMFFLHCFAFVLSFVFSAPDVGMVVRDRLPAPQVHCFCFRCSFYTVFAFRGVSSFFCARPLVYDYRGTGQTVFHAVFAFQCSFSVLYLLS